MNYNCGSYVYVAITVIVHAQNVEVRYIRGRDEQLRIAKACHNDKTSGHLGFRKTLARITERFAWKGVSKDAKEIVSSYMHMHAAYS